MTMQWKCQQINIRNTNQLSWAINYPPANICENWTECWFWRSTICCLSINKMGQLYRMLILKACPYQLILSSKGTETTNGTASQHHPYQQICWSTRWVNRPDCSFWPPFDISCHPETTKWVARPIWINFTKILSLSFHKLAGAASVHFFVFLLLSR